MALAVGLRECSWREAFWLCWGSLKGDGVGEWLCWVVVVMFKDSIWVFPKIRVPQNGWFIMGNPIKMDDLGVHLLSETAIWSCSFF